MRTAVKLVFLLSFATSCVTMMSATPIIIDNGTFTGCSDTPTPTCQGWTLTRAAQGSNFQFFPGKASFGGEVPGDYDKISQVVSTTSGASYTIEFDLSSRSGVSGDVGPADFQVTWDGTAVFEDKGLTAFGPTPFSVTVTGTGSDTLAFQAFDMPAWYELSNVTVPEPSMLAMLIPALGFVEVLRRKFSR